MQTKTFRQRVIAGGLWTISANLMSQVIRFGSNLITTRLLLPEAFGLVAISQALIMGLHFFTDLGLNQSLIRSADSDSKFVNTIWTIRFLQGVGIWLVSILGAGIIYLLAENAYFPSDSVYADSRLPLIIIVTGFASVLNGFTSTNMVLAERNLNFKVNVSINLLSQVVSLIFMVVVAYIYQSVWALVIGQITAVLVQVWLSYALFDGERNHFLIDKEKLGEIVHFGKWVFLCSVVSYLYIASDKIVLGFLVDKNILGQYAVATLLIGAVKALISLPVSKLGLPALSEAFRENPDSLKRVFYKMRFPIDIIAMFLAGFLFITAETLVDALYDNRYESAGWMLQIFAIGLMEFRYKLNGECYMALGKPQLTTTLIFLDVVFLYVGMFLLFNLYGLVGLVWVVACSSMTVIPLNFYFMHKYNLLDWKKEALTVPYVFVGVIFGYAFNYIFNLITS